MITAFDRALAAMPIVAILRGVTPESAVDVGFSLYEAGIRIIEVPLNSPDPFDSIRRLATALADCVIGAGTVLQADDVGRVKAAGGTIIVAPNTDRHVIRASVNEGLVPIPGFQTATEAFSAIGAGARHLKLFPASSNGPGHLRALYTVLPADVQILAVGGVGLKNLKDWQAAGACGLGIGSELYQPGWSAAAIRERARDVVQAVHDCY